MSVDSRSNCIVGPVPTSRWPRRLDRLGAIVAFVCALHCAALPIVLALTPLAGVQWLTSHWFDQWAVVLALIFGAAVIGVATSLRPSRQVLAGFALAGALLLTGAFWVHEPAWAHALLLTTGGALLGMTHLVNHRSVERHGCTCNCWR